MKSKLFVLFTLSVLVLNMAASAVADTRSRSTVKASELVALLPASDIVAVFDVKRFLTSALPQILSGNQPMIAEVTKAIEEAKTKTGIDVRQFDSVAAGVTARKIAEKKYDTDTVLIARGQMNSGAVLAAAKLAANGKYREEKVGSRTIYIFEAKQIVDQNLPQTGTGTAGAARKLLNRLSKEMAATALDGTTIAMGDVEKVKETAAGSSHVAKDVSDLLVKTSSPVANFAARAPEGMSSFVPLDNDELGKNIDSIKYLYGSMDVVGANTTLNATARTLQAEQAIGLKDTLEGLQMLGKAFLGGAKGADKQVYARLVENVKFTTKGNEVTMDLAIAQSDMDFLVGLLSK